MRILSSTSLSRLLQVRFHNLPTRPRVQRAGERSKGDTLPPIHWTSNLSPTRQRGQRQKATNGTQPLELVILEDDSALLPRKVKGAGKKACAPTPGEDEGLETLSQCLKGEARAIQYNLELGTLTEYRNLHILNLKGPPNTDDHSAYLSIVRDISWSYPAKGNLITARQFFKDLTSSKDQEAIEAGNNVL